MTAHDRLALEKGTTSIAFNNSFDCSCFFFCFFFRLFVELHVRACPIKALLGTATCCKFASLLPLQAALSAGQTQ